MNKKNAFTVGVQLSRNMVLEIVNNVTNAMHARSILTVDQG